MSSLFIFCVIQQTLSVQGLPLGLALGPRVFTSSSKAIFFLHQCKDFHIIIYLDGILVLLCSKCTGRRAQSFLCLLLVCLELHINFSKVELHSTHTSVFRMFWGTVDTTVSLPSDKLLEIQQLDLSSLQSKTFTVCCVMSFQGKMNFCASGHAQRHHMCHIIQSNMLNINHCTAQLFCSCDLLSYT